MTKSEQARAEHRYLRGDQVALDALERARAMQDKRGFFRVAKPKRFTGQGRAKMPSEAQVMTPGPGWGDVGSGPRPSWRDPRPLGESLSKVITQSGWSRQLAVAKLRTQWESIVGPTVAQHAALDSFEDGILTIMADSSSWAVNLQNLLGHLDKTIADHVGEGIVEKIVIKSVQKVSWKHGRLSVPGRGIRDTYD